MVARLVGYQQQLHASWREELLPHRYHVVSYIAMMRVAAGLFICLSIDNREALRDDFSRMQMLSFDPPILLCALKVWVAQTLVLE